MLARSIVGAGSKLRTTPPRTRPEPTLHALGLIKTAASSVGRQPGRYRPSATSRRCAVEWPAVHKRLHQRRSVDFSFWAAPSGLVRSKVPEFAKGFDRPCGPVWGVCGSHASEFGRLQSFPSPSHCGVLVRTRARRAGGRRWNSIPGPAPKLGPGARPRHGSRILIPPGGQGIPPELNWPSQHFEAGSVAFIDGSPPDGFRLSRYKDPIRDVWTYRLWRDDKSADVDPAWARYAVAKAGGYLPLSYHERDGGVVAPLGFPLPALAARALTLCSGIAPIRQGGHVNFAQVLQMSSRSLHTSWARTTGALTPERSDWRVRRGSTQPHRLRQDRFRHSVRGTGTRTHQAF